MPSICENRVCNDDERKLLSLPVKLGGLGLTNVTYISDIEFQQSKLWVAKFEFYMFVLFYSLI